MGEWKKVRLGDYLIEHTEKTTRNNQYPVLTSSRVGLFLQTDYYNRVVASKDNTGYNVVPYGYFTYRHMSDDEVFKFNINTIVEKGIVSTLYPVFTTRGINDIFLKYLLNEGAEFKKYAFFQKQGGSRTYIYFSMLQNLRLTMPALEEQHRIAEVLIAADEAIATSRALVEKYAAVKQGLIRDLLTGEGEPIKIGRLGGRFFRGQGISRAETTVDGVPCIRYGELYTTYDTVTSEVYSRTSEETARHCKHIQYGDLLFTLSGETAEDIGKTVAYIGSEDVVVGGDLAVLTGHGQNPIYLSYMLNSASARKQKELASTGATIVHINATKLGAITIPLPDIERQNEVADILTAADDRLTAERERLAKLENIKRGLMDDLLTNRVSTDTLKGGREYA